MGIIGGSIKTIFEARKAKELAIIKANAATEAAKIKADSQMALVEAKKTAMSKADLKQLNEHLHAFHDTLQHHGELLHEILKIIGG